MQRDLLLACSCDGLAELLAKRHGVHYKSDIMQQTRHVGFFMIMGLYFLAELSARHGTAQGMPPEDCRIQHPIAGSESLPHTTRQDNRFHSPESQADDGRFH